MAFWWYRFQRFISLNAEHPAARPKRLQHIRRGIDVRYSNRIKGAKISWKLPARGNGALDCIGSMTEGLHAVLAATGGTWSGRKSPSHQAGKTGAWPIAGKVCGQPEGSILNSSSSILKSERTCISNVASVRILYSSCLVQDIQDVKNHLISNNSQV